MSSRNRYYQAENEADLGITSTPKLVYKPRICRCGLGAKIKIVESEKASKGALYFRCPKPHRERCGFFNWCLPEGRGKVGNFDGCSATKPYNVSASNVSDDAGPLQREVMNLCRQLDYSKLKLMRHPDCAKFRDKPLPLEDEMRILFGSNTATGEHKLFLRLGYVRKLCLLNLFGVLLIFVAWTLNFDDECR